MFQMYLQEQDLDVTVCLLLGHHLKEAVVCGFDIFQRAVGMGRHFKSKCFSGVWCPPGVFAPVVGLIV